MSTQASPGGLRADPLLRRWGAVAVGWVVAYTVAAVLVRGRDTATTVLGSGFYLLPLIVCAILSAVAARRCPARHRAFWLTMTASNVLWLVGELVFSTYALVLRRETPFPSLADVFYIASYVLALPAIVLGARGRFRGVHWGSALNSFLIVAGLAVAGFAILIEPQLPYGLSLATLAGVAYPLLGLAILMLLTGITVRTDRTVPLTVGIVGAAFAVSAVTDTAYTYLVVLHEYASGSLLDIGWQVEAVLLCLAALVAIRTGEDVPRLHHSPADVRNAIVLAASAATLGALVVAVEDRTLSEITALIAVAAVLAAQFRLYAEARRQERRARQQAADNSYLALHDGLTGLPNRRLFHDRVRQAAQASRRDGSSCAVLLMDLDRFKEINDTLGHNHGDLLLQEIGARLTDTLREADSVARLGGDEFAVLLPTLPDGTSVEQAVTRIRTELERPFEVQGMALDGSASIGVALCPDHGDDVDTLLQRADVAMYVAKDTRVPYAIYSPDLDRHTAQGLAMVSDLRRAIEAGRLVLCYQPKVSLSTGSVVGVEALVRWPHPVHGLVMPDDFIPVAEHTGLIKPLTAWVLEAALAQCQRWCEAGIRLPVAVNLSPRALFDADLPADVTRMLRNAALDANMLELEVTEGAVMAHPARALGLLQQLSDMGVRLSIDDFGVGYSSLSYLKLLPVRELKIDRSFVENMTEDLDDAKIVRSTVDLASATGCRGSAATSPRATSSPRRCRARSWSTGFSAGSRASPSSAATVGAPSGNSGESLVRCPVCT